MVQQHAAQNNPHHDDNNKTDALENDISLASITSTDMVSINEAPAPDTDAPSSSSSYLPRQQAVSTLQAMWRSRVVRVDFAEQLQQMLAAQDSQKAMQEAEEYRKNIEPTFLGVLSLVFGDVFTMFGVLVVGVIQAVSTIGLAVVFSYFFDDLTTLTSNGKYAVFDFDTLLLLGVLGILQGVAAFSKALLVDLGGNNLAVKLRIRLVQGVCACTLDWFDSRHSANDIFKAMEEDMEVLTTSFYKECVECFWDALSAFTALGAMALISVPVTVSVIFAIPPLAMLDAAFSTALVSYKAKYTAREGESDKEALDLLRRLRLIREHAMLNKELDDFLVASRDTRKYYVFVAILRATYQLLVVTFATAFLCLILYFEGKLAEDGKVSVGTSLACLVLSFFAHYYLSHLLEGLPQIVSGFGVAKKIKQLVNEAEYAELAPGDEHIYIARKQKRGARAAQRKVEPDASKAALAATQKRLNKQRSKKEGAEPEEEEQKQGVVEFVSVVFAYPMQPTDLVLRGFNAKLPAESISAFISKHGTSARAAGMMILGHYTPRKGYVTLDEVDVATIETPMLRKMTMALNAESQMFRGTIAENVLYGQATVEDRDEVAERNMLLSCLEYAGIDRFVSNLENGADTMLKGEDGEDGDGVTLSMNQRRRLQLARLFFRNPMFVIVDGFLDEALLKASGTATQSFNAEASSMRSAYRRALKQPFHRTALVCARTADEVFSSDHAVFILDGKPVESGLVSKLEQATNSMMAEFVDHEEEAVLRWFGKKLD